MVLEKGSLGLLQKAIDLLEKGFENLPENTLSCPMAEMEKVLLETAGRMQDNYPYFHPLYAGQMLKPPHPIARLAYMLALWINPNNHALDGGRASSRMEKEAVVQIADVFGWPSFLGHLTGGGTMANLEALWVSGQLHPGQTIVASEQAHYTHSRISEVLKLPFESVPCDPNTCMDTNALAQRLEKGDVGTVVATIGTTGTGAVDPLPEILKLRDKHGFRLHADAAYGGYFTLAGNLGAQARQAYDRLSQVDSLVIDPHKHGLQPYGCGCVLFKDPSVGRFYKHDSPYTYFSSSELHLGEISLECSRPGASAVALWATQQLLPLVQGGELAKGLEKSRRAALDLFHRLQGDDRFMTLFAPELDIVIWAPASQSASRISKGSEALFQAAAQQNLHLATFQLPCRLVEKQWPQVTIDQDHVVLMRSCLMKPEHEAWLDRIWDILDTIMANVNF